MRSAVSARLPRPFWWTLWLTVGVTGLGAGFVLGLIRPRPEAG